MAQQTPDRDIANLPTEITHALHWGMKKPAPRRMQFSAAAAMQPLPDALELAANSGENRPDVIVWCGNQPGRRMIRADVDAAKAAGWTVSNYRSEMRAATFTRHGYRVDVRSSATWFGNAADPDTIHDAWYDLSRWLRSGFGEWAYLWPTPTMTGQELLRRAIPRGSHYPVLPPVLLELLLVNLGGGGRTELLTAPGGLNGGLGFVPELYNLDMRWSYASCLHHLPVGKAHHVKTTFARDLTVGQVGYEPSFYKFSTIVPANWKHIGLLPHREQTADGSTTVWPHRPGEEFWGWATGAELLVALNHGWAVQAIQKIHWPETGNHDVMRPWVTTLRKLRERVQRRELGNDPLAPLVAGALRSIVVHTVGSWNRVAREDEGYAPYGYEATSIPSGGIPYPEAGGWGWRRRVEHVDEWSHPEWFATVVGRVRAKLATRAMGMPPETLVALRTDGILTTREPDVSNDAGSPGSWRVKWHLPYSLPAPRSVRDILRIIEAGGVEAGELDSDHREEGE